MNRTSIPMLSKSRFVAGLQCPLRLWNQCYHPELATQASPSRQAVFDAGHEVGRVATGLYPGGMLIAEDHLHHEEAVESTRSAMTDPKVPALYEAAFVHDDLRVRVDVLKRLKGGKWDLIEVKSSTSVKNVYEPDVAVQYLALRGLGLNIARAGILHLNNQYVYDGQRLDLEDLFCFCDLTGKIVDRQPEISSKLSELREMLRGSAAPDVSPSRHCRSPYPCEFWEHCTAEKPEFWVMNLSGIGQNKLDELAALGVEDIRDVPDSFPLTALHQRIKACVSDQKEYVAPELAEELRQVEYPIHFLDFETIGPGIPRYANTRPYQTIPFQWSDHILFEDGRIEHREYLHDEDTDPREQVARTLLETLGDEGTIFMYTSYELDVTQRLAEGLPRYGKKLLATLDRFKDLYAVIKRHFYHPQFHGSFSLKSVLPAIVPSMTYGNLAIQEGNQASLEYLRMLDPSASAHERAKIKANLLTYCAHDTLAMVRLREELLKRF